MNIIGINVLGIIPLYTEDYLENKVKEKHVTEYLENNILNV